VSGGGGVELTLGTYREGWFVLNFNFNFSDWVEKGSLLTFRIKRRPM